jgi:hypothetical protein
MVEACSKVSDALTQTLESLKVDSQNGSSTWGRLRAAVRTQRKAEEIKGLEERLTRLRSQICDHVNMGLLYVFTPEVR